MKLISLKTTIKVGRRKIRLDDMDCAQAENLVCLLQLHKERVNNMYRMGTARQALYDAMAKK